MKLNWMLTGLAMVAVEAWSADVTHWRGPHQTGVFDAENLPAEWSKEGKNLAWQVPYGCRSTPLVMNGRVYMINRAGDDVSLQERVVCLDLKTGKLLWEHRFNVFLTDIVAHRLGWANLAGDPATGNIYAHGVQGLFFCFNPDGKVLWERSLTEEFGRISGYGGRTNTPVVEGDLVLISSLTSGWGPHGKPVHRMLAMDKRTGEVRYWSEPSGKPLDTTYSVPVIVTLDGKRTLFMGLADGAVVSMNTYTGDVNWSVELSKRGINSSVVYGNGKVYACHSEENFDTTKMGKVVCLDARTGKELWAIPGLPCGYASPVLHDGVLYVPENSANLVAVDAESGETLWHHNYGKEAKGSPAYADGKIYVGEVGGAYHILQVSREGCKDLSEVTFQARDGRPIEIFGTPVVADGYVLLPTMQDTYCISSGKKGGVFKWFGKKDEGNAPEAAAVSHNQDKPVFQIEPAETVLKPGGAVTFKVQTDDGKGGFTHADLAKAEWSVKGLSGTVDAAGTYTAPEGTRMEAGVVTVKIGDRASSARVRAVPGLPYKEDFNDLPLESPPPGWITSKLKSKVIEFEGEKVLLKLADQPAPPFARLRCYMMPPVDAPYTVQADLYGVSKKKRWIPDMGLINSRYLMILLGTTERTRKLRLVTYAAVPRLQHDIEFDWKPDTWYTMKLRVDIEDGKDGKQAMVRGKVWPRGETEPEAWTTEMMDPYPNTEGSPGLYGYSVMITSKSKGTEVLFDNVEITP